MVGFCIYFYELFNPNSTQDNPFKLYDNNTGIIIISIASLSTRVVFIVCFLLLASVKFKYNKAILTAYILAALAIGFLQWFELYFGSTFYYGEVRDKQGLMFPILASFMMTLVIWKLNYSQKEDNNLNLKFILTGLINIGLYFLWGQVYEPWNLWQS
tara:strand:+ start:85489 stop:85959 length:471 start_codon:yes stop_codon:yes gene_type:complete